MESFFVEIVNPKAKSILKGLVNLNMIRIQKTETTSKFDGLLNKFRKNRGSLSFDETTEVEALRKKVMERK